MGRSGVSSSAFVNVGPDERVTLTEEDKAVIRKVVECPELPFNATERAIFHLWRWKVRKGLDHVTEISRAHYRALFEMARRKDRLDNAG